MCAAEDADVKDIQTTHVEVIFSSKTECLDGTHTKKCATKRTKKRNPKGENVQKPKDIMVCPSLSIPKEKYCDWRPKMD